MATKKTAASAKKKTGAKPKAAKTTTRVTTVKAVESGGAPAAVRPLAGIGVLRMPIMSAAMAEFIGAFLLGVTILIVRNEPFYLFIGLVGIFMLIGGLSGAHINPAVTVGAWVTRRIHWVRAVSYMAAQFLGAMLAFVTMSAFVNQAPEVSAEAASFGQTAPQLFSAAALPEGKEQVVLIAEVLGLAILGFAYANVLKPRITDKVTGAFTIGGAGFIAMALASTAAAYVGGSVAINPAIAVSLSAIDLSDVSSAAWTLGVYFVAPLVGAVIGFFLHDLLRVAEAEK